MTLRLGIDIGGTNTDCVLLDESGMLIRSAKSSTTTDIASGVVDAVSRVLCGVSADEVSVTVLGTTQCTNALVERRRLRRVGVLRIGSPAGDAIPPLLDWPADLAAACLADWVCVGGGHHVDGRRISPFDGAAIRHAALRWRDDVEAVAVTSVFSPIDNSDELRAVEILESELDVPISISSLVGSLGFIERENASVINAALTGVAEQAVAGFLSALEQCGVSAHAYLSQNDGTLMPLDAATRQPVRTIGSGPTNSIRGAGRLADLADALVIDVGGTTSDVGVLANALPRESSIGMQVGGVATNFRMPDVMGLAIGGGTIVRGARGAIRLGPDSVGQEIASRALCFGGDVLTLTDIAVALGHELGDVERVRREVTVADAQEVMSEVSERFARAIAHMNTRRSDATVIAVGGGAFLVPDQIPGAATVIRPDHAPVANALGAAIAEAGGDVDQVWDLSKISRDDARAQAELRAREQAVAAGADPAAVRIVELEEIGLAYLPENTVRIRARAVGPMASIDMNRVGVGRR